MNRGQLHEKLIRHFQMEAAEQVGGLKDEQWQPVVLVPMMISRNIGPIKSIKFHLKVRRNDIIYSRMVPYHERVFEP